MHIGKPSDVELLRMARADLDWDWDDLRYLLRAVQAGTLAGAARAMGVEHTTIGRRLTALERSLGAPLVLRGPEGLKLTPLGEKVAPMLEEVERAVAAVRDAVASHRARVRLAVPSGFTGLFTGGLAQLGRDHPGVALEIVSGARPADLKRGEADLAIRSGPVADRDLVARRLCECGWSVYASDAYLARGPSLDLGDLRGHDVIGYDTSLAAVPAAKWIEERAAGATIVLRSREMTDMVAAALSGVGLAVVPCLLGDAEPGLRRLTSEVVATRHLSLVYRREARLSESVRAVVRFVVDTMREHAARIGGHPPHP
jgi:DNA-binding transcriptional LysR family regulator